MRHALFSLGFLGALLGLGLVATRLEVPTPRSPLEALAKARDVLGQPRPIDRPALFFLGDSTAIWYPQDHSVPERLQQSLSLRGDRTRVVSLGYDAMFPFDYYALADSIARTGPDRVVLAVNFFAFAARAPQYFARPAVAAWISPGRWPEAARLPLYWAGVRYDQLLFGSSLLRLGGLDAWIAADAAALRVGEAFARARTGDDTERPRTARDRWIRDNAGMRGKRQLAAGALDRYGAALRGIPPDHPALRFLGAAVSRFTAAGIPVTAYIVPINVEHLAKVGVDDAAGRARSVASVRDCVESNGGRLFDFHDLLADDWFRDPAGHFTHDGARDGPRRLAEALTRGIPRDDALGGG